MAQSCTLSVSVQIVAGRDDFAERGSVSRSTLRATDALDLSKRWAAGQAPAGHRPALLWLRLRRAGPYRRVALCQPLENADAFDQFRGPREVNMTEPNSNDSIALDDFG